MHTDELEAFKQQYPDPNTLLMRLAQYRQPRKKAELTEYQKQSIEYFKQACNEAGFTICTITKNGIKCRRMGYSDIMEYNARADCITYSNRRNSTIFDKVLENHILAVIENRFHELRGDGMVNTYNVLDVISKTLENVNDLLNK